MNHIGNTIRDLRHFKGWSQSQVAAKLNMSVSAYSKTEAGITDINLSRLVQIADIYEMPLTDMFDTTRLHERTNSRFIDRGLLDRLDAYDQQIIALHAGSLNYMSSSGRHPKQERHRHGHFLTCDADR